MMDDDKTVVVMRRKNVAAAAAAATTTANINDDNDNFSSPNHNHSIMMQRRRVVRSSKRQPIPRVPNRQRQHRSLYGFVRLRCHRIVEYLCSEGRAGNFLFYACGFLLTLWMVLVLLVHNRLLSIEEEESIFYLLSKTTMTTSVGTGDNLFFTKQHFQLDSPLSSFQRRRAQRRRKQESKLIDSSLGSTSFRILFPDPLMSSFSMTTTIPTMMFHHPLPLGPEEQAEGEYIDHRPENMRFFDEQGGRRFIYKDRNLLENHFREPFLPRDDDQDGYYAIFVVPMGPSFVACYKTSTVVGPVNIG
jgi:hypothetical protein